MRYVSVLLGIWCLAICLNLVNSNSVYDRKCNHSSECAVYPDIAQGPDVIWIPFFCNEKNVCACPNGWIPLVTNEICIAKVSLGSWTEPTCAAYIWGISFLILTLLAVITYSCISLFSRRSRPFRSIKNDQHLHPGSQEAPGSKRDQDT